MTKKNAKAALRIYKEAVKEHENPPLAPILALVKEGVDVHATDNIGRTLLHFASSYGHWDVCVELIKQHADIHARDIQGDTPLHRGAYRKSLRILKLLLDHGADIHALNDRGNTPLHDAIAFTDRPEAAKLLLAHGANIWAQNNAGKTALDLDKEELIKPHLNGWKYVLDEVKNRKYDYADNPQALHCIASVMKPADPKDIPHPKEFIRILFQQYLPHEPKFNAMYEEIFSQQRLPSQDLQSVRKTAQGRGTVL